MSKLVVLICPVILLVFAGCSRINIPFFGNSAEQTADSESLNAEDFQSNEFVAKGRFVDAQRLQDNKNIVFVPFKAGIGAIASDELDRTSLMIIKGISDAFADDKSGKHDHFSVLNADKADSAELIVKGYITDMAEPSKFKKWILMKRKKVLAVEGKIIDVKTGETIVLFEDHAIASSKSEGYADLGTRIGNSIGRYILSGIK